MVGEDLNKLAGIGAALAGIGGAASIAAPGNPISAGLVGVGLTIWGLCTWAAK